MHLLQTEKNAGVFAYLRKKPYVNLNMICKLENTSIPVYTDCPENPSGVVLKDGYMHFLYTESEAFIEAVLDTFMSDGYFGFSGVDQSIAQRIQAKRKLDWENPCTIYAYKKDHVDLIDCVYTVKSLDVSDAEIVDSYYEYSNENSLERIREDIKNRPSSAVYDDGKPVCWVLVHEDGSMGIMYTMESHRRMGLAEVVSRDLTKKLVDLGKVPFLQIVDGNEKSHGLAAKCGFEPVGKCSWFGIVCGEALRDEE